MFIKNFNNLRENGMIEFKKANGGLPNSIWETYSAFSNTNGGTIILGIDELQKGVFESAKLSLNDVYNLQCQFWNTINNSQKVNINTLLDKDVYVEEYNGDAILVINIRRANRFEKPVFINNNLYSGTYRRNNEGDYHCTKAEVDLMVKDSSSQSADKTCLEEFSIEDLDINSISGYKQMLKSVNPGHVFLTLTDEMFYLNLGIAKRGSDGLLHPTRAGLLMFGKEYRITDEFNHYFLDYQNHREETPEIRWIDRVQSSSGEWSGNIFDFFFKVYNKMIQDLTIPFKLQGAQRVDDTEMHIALREALCNTLTNADYYGVRGVVINQYKDKIEFSNPGCMRISKEEAYEGVNTDPRNETILKMFSLIKIGERAGTGTLTILNIIKKYGYPMPNIEEKFNPDRTKLTIYFGVKDAVLNKNDKELEQNSLTQEEIEVMNFINNKIEISRSDIENLLGCKKSKSNNILKKLLEAGLITRIESSRNTKYRKK